MIQKRHGVILRLTGLVLFLKMKRQMHHRVVSAIHKL